VNGMSFKGTGLHYMKLCNSHKMLQWLIGIYENSNLFYLEIQRQAFLKSVNKRPLLHYFKINAGKKKCIIIEPGTSNINNINLITGHSNEPFSPIFHSQNSPSLLNLPSGHFLCMVEDLKGSALLISNNQYDCESLQFT
jgi:hypothetical protein